MNIVLVEPPSEQEQISGVSIPSELILEILMKLASSVSVDSRGFTFQIDHSSLEERNEQEPKTPGLVEDPDEDNPARAQ